MQTIMISAPSVHGSFVNQLQGYHTYLHKIAQNLTKKVAKAKYFANRWHLTTLYFCIYVKDAD